MQTPVDQITFEQQAEQLGRVFANCVQKEFEDILPNATITIYLKQPKSYEQGGGESAIRYDISDDTVSEETLEYQMNLHRDSLIQRFLDKASSEYSESKRYPGVDNQIRHLGKVLQITHLESGSTDLPDINISDFTEIAKIALEKKWFYKIEIDRDLVVKVIRLTAPYLVKLLEEPGTELIEFIKENLD